MFKCTESNFTPLHVSGLRWKWRGALNKTVILHMGPRVSFHVKLGEDKKKQYRAPKAPTNVYSACYFGCSKGGFKVSSGTVEWHRSSYGPDSCNSLN